MKENLWLFVFGLIGFLFVFFMIVSFYNGLFFIVKDLYDLLCNRVFLL